MIVTTRRLLTISSGAPRRPTRIVIPAVPTTRSADGTTGSGGPSSSSSSPPQQHSRTNYTRGGSLSTDRYMARAAMSAADGGAEGGRKKLFVDTPYISESHRDRWSGSGPAAILRPSLHESEPVIGFRRNTRHTLAAAGGGAAKADANDPNDDSRSFGNIMGAPSQDTISPGEAVAKVVGGTEAEFVRQRRERQRFLNAVDEQHEQIWRDSKSHIRATERSMEMHGGIEGAIADRLAPKMPSASSEVRGRPLDKRILEEIYKDAHGLRSEQALKKNLGYERWTARAERNAPVMSASRRAQETFGFGGTAQIVRQATTRDQFPVTPMPEVAFLGRTNSGRSSLINALLNSYVCRYGHLKGTTKTADFVNVGDKLMLVDLPGYGYFHPFSSDPLRVKQGQALNESYIAACASSPMVRDFRDRRDKNSNNRNNSDGASSSSKPEPQIATLDGRQRNIKRVFVCVPCVTGLQDGDASLCAMLEERGIPFSVLLTKTDLMPIRQLARMADLTRSKVAKYTCCEELMMVNSLRLAGITRMQNMLGNIARKEALSTDPLEMSFDNIV